MKIFLVSLFIIQAIALTGCTEEQKTPDAPLPKVDGGKITFSTNAPQLSYLSLEPAQARQAAVAGLYGRLAWNDDITARIYSPVAGRVINLPVEVNQQVSSNATLALLNSPDFGQALANARTAMGNLVAADKANERAHELFDHGAAAQKDVEAAAATLVAAEAERDRAEATLVDYGGCDTATNEIYSLRSPLAGVLVEKNINPGEEIRPDLMLANAQQFIDPQFVVTDPTQLWLFLDADELDVAMLTPGREVFIHTQAYPDKVFHGRLEVIGHELDPTTRTIKTRCLVDNRENLLRAEMYVTADVASVGTTGVDVPTKAVFLKDDEHCIFVEMAPGQFERRTVKLGAENNGRTAIMSGISAGEQVVSDGCLLLESIIEGAGE